MSDAAFAASRNLDSVPFPVLIGDIGGTNARFALIDSATAPAQRLPTAHTAAHKNIDDAIQAVVIEGAKAAPRTAILALAAPIAGDSVPLTNCPWVVEPKQLIARFGLSEVILLNDFEAQSLALPGLEDGDLEPIGGGTRVDERPRVVLGPGTGLGVGGLVYARGTWVTVPGEGGHVELGPVGEREYAIWPNIERPHPRMSAENVLCGPGMLRLYRAVCATDGVAPRHATPEDVTAHGLSGKDGQAAQTLAIFAACLGRLAGDLALTFMARGGVYLSGGISSQIAPALQAGAFRASFESKAPHDHIMRRIPTAIVVKKDAPLAGIAAFARDPSRFGVDLVGRRWQG